MIRTGDASMIPMSAPVDIAQGIGQTLHALPFVLSQMVMAEPCPAFRTFLVQVVLGIYLFVACNASYS